MLKLTQQQIEQLNNLPKCKNCGQGLDTKQITFTSCLNLNHACGDDTTINLKGSFDYTVGAWVVINGNLLEEIYGDIRRGAEASKSLYEEPKTENQEFYEQGWRDGLQQLGNIMVTKYGGGDE